MIDAHRVRSATVAVPERGRLEELYERHAPAASRLAYLLTGDPALAEDLVHDAFVRVVGRFAHLRVPDAFDAYLRRTIVNLHTSQLRRRRVERAFLERERASARTTTVSMPDIASREELWIAVRALPARQRAAIVLRYYEDLSDQQVADALRCSPAAVKSLVARAMETLRDRIGKDTA